MKTNLYTAGFSFLLIILWGKSNAQANTSLSNLVPPTRVNVDLLPGVDNTRSVGSLARSWRNIYLDSAIYLDSSRFIAFKTGSGIANTAVGASALNAGTTGSSNTATGYRSLYSNTTGSDNVATGASALYSNVSGQSNIAIGRQTMYHDSIGSQNMATGSGALFSNTSGNGNTAVGYHALRLNTTGYSNVAIGINALNNNVSLSNCVAVGDSALFHQSGTGYFMGFNSAFGSKALYSTTTGSENTATGYQSLYSNTDGGQNTANGAYSLLKNTSGSGNVAEGYETLLFNTTGNWNTANGWSALYSNKTGSYNTANGYQALLFNNGTGNTADGAGALYYNYSGKLNTAMGNASLSNNSSGSYNVAIGDATLEYNVSGSYNVAVGEQALGGGGSLNNISQSVAVGYDALFNPGKYCTALGTNAGMSNEGVNNTYIGYGANVSGFNTVNNATAIGNGAAVGVSNHIHIGNSSVTSIGGQVSWTSFSDERIKNNIQQNVPGLQFINLLKPVTYHFNLSKQENISGRKDSSDYDGKGDIEKIQFTGFLAQEVEAAAKKINYDFSGVDAPKSDKDLYGLRYSDFVVPLVKAVQELSGENDSLRSEITNLKSEIDEIKTMIASNQSTVNGQQSTIISSASLAQNIPNPFNRTTIINYTLPQQYSSAGIIITDKNGSTLKQINLPAGRQGLSGNKGSVSVDASTLSSGAYQYSLIVDGKLIGTKQMILAK